MSPSLATHAPAALTVVLRDTGPRAAVLVELLGGDGAAVEPVLAQALGWLGRELQQGPVTDWTQRFWALLLAAPMLRSAVPGARWVGDESLLATLSPGLRAVLLLRLVARLDDTQAARALGVPLGTQRQALRRALPRDAHGRPDPVAWQSLRAACERRLRQGPDPRKGRLDGLFALAARPSHAPSTRSPGMRGLWLGLAACVLGLAGSFLLGSIPHWNPDTPAEAIPLPPASEPASRFDAGTAVLSHPDYDALAAPEDLRLADDLAFYAWYATQRGSGANGARSPSPSADAPLPGGAAAVAR